MGKQRSKQSAYLFIGKTVRIPGIIHLKLQALTNCLHVFTVKQPPTIPCVLLLLHGVTFLFMLLLGKDLQKFAFPLSILT